MRARSFGQASRGLTRRRSSSPKLAMARATMPMLSGNCGSTRMTEGFAAGVRAGPYRVSERRAAACG